MTEDLGQRKQACQEPINITRSSDNRPLTHIVRRDSRTIPGTVMADIWVRVRQRIATETFN